MPPVLTGVCQRAGCTQQKSVTPCHFRWHEFGLIGRGQGVRAEPFEQKSHGQKSLAGLLHSLQAWSA